MDLKTETNENLDNKKNVRKLKILEKIKSLRNFDKEKFKENCEKTVESLQLNGKTLAATVIIAIILMFLVCWIVFFATVRNPEQVMVPNVVGKELSSALLEMQAKELYPKIQLRYTDNPDDAGKILTQNPGAGAIVKAGRRISLTVSRGVIVDKVGNYVGQNYDDVKINLQTMFTGAQKQLIELEEPAYKADQSEAGTIIAQEPAEGTPISAPVKVKLVVSRGPAYENTRVPNIVGMNLASLLKTMSAGKVVFEFTETEPEKDADNITVVSEEKPGKEFVANYTRIKAEIAIPRKESGGKVYGLFTANLPSYPYPVDMALESTGSDGISETIVSLKHTGGKVTIPYLTEKGNELVLNVAGKKAVRKTVE